jgi:hypothetical protein
VTTTLGVLGYLALGVVSDGLCAAYYLSVSRGRAWLASALSVLIALLNFFVLSRVLIVEPSWYNAVAYAVGNGAGSFLIMKARDR